MSRTFSVGAIAVPSRRANAVGAVRITLTEDALELELLRIARYASGFVPGSPAAAVLLRVPYIAVRGLVRDKGALCLALDDAAVTPFNRFALAHFTADPESALAHGLRMRTLRDGVAWAVPLTLAAVSVALAPPYLVAGALGEISLALVVAVVAWACVRVIAEGLLGGLASARLRDAFEAELSARLGVIAKASATRRERAPALPLVRPVSVGIGSSTDAQTSQRSAIHRPSTEDVLFVGHAWRSPVFGGVVALITVFVMAFLQQYARERTPPSAVPVLRARLASLVGGSPGKTPPRPLLPRCPCLRADSPLWARGVPAISVLMFEGEHGVAPPSPKLDHDGFPQYKFDVAIVNNAARPYRDIRLTLTFARRTEGGKRRGAVDRGLFWEGALYPGQAVKWRVAAPGNELRVDASVTETLAAAKLEPASPDAFFKLTSSKNRAVRVHAATMLAYLRDRRAADVVSALAVDADAESPWLSQIQRAIAPVIACDVRVRNGFLEACIFNSSEKSHPGVSVVDVRRENDGATRFEVPIETPIAVHDGVRIHVAIPANVGEVMVRDPGSP